MTELIMIIGIILGWWILGTGLFIIWAKIEDEPITKRVLVFYAIFGWIGGFVLIAILIYYVILCLQELDDTKPLS